MTRRRICERFGTFSASLDGAAGRLIGDSPTTAWQARSRLRTSIRQARSFQAVLVRLCGPCKLNDSGIVKVTPSQTQLVSGDSWVRSSPRNTRTALFAADLDHLIRSPRAGSRSIAEVDQTPTHSIRGRVRLRGSLVGIWVG
jgi:hypothetical protein